MTNLRGHTVRFAHGERQILGTVITRIRGTRWLVSSPHLSREQQRLDGSRRITLDESEFSIVQPTVKRQARSPIEAMIDRACGL